MRDERNDGNSDLDAEGSETNPKQVVEGGGGPSVELLTKSKSVLPLWAKVLVMMVIVFLASIGYLRSSHPQNAESPPDIQAGPSDVPAPAQRKPVPDIVLIAGAGQSKRLSDFKGHVVLLSFWASWCTPCLVELPTFIDLHEKLSAKGLMIVPVNVDTPEESANFVSDFWKTKKFPFPTFFDPDRKSSEVFQIDSLPSNFVLDKQGRLVAQGYGANDWSSDTSVKFIEQLLTEQDTYPSPSK